MSRILLRQLHESNPNLSMGLTLGVGNEMFRPLSESKNFGFIFIVPITQTDRKVFHCREGELKKKKNST